MPDSDQVVAQSHLDLENRIRQRAHEIWLSHRNNGNAERDTALDDWLAAEKEVLGEDEHSSAQNRGTVVGAAGASGRVLGLDDE